MTRTEFSHWNVRILAIAAATALLVGCNDSSDLPTGIDDPMDSVPQLVPGDSLRIVVELPAAAPSKCIDLSAVPGVVLGDTAYICIPVAPVEGGLVSLSVQAQQRRWDLRSGTYRYMDVFEPVELSAEDGLSDLTKKKIFIPALVPVDTQEPGEFVVRVILVGTSEQQGEYSVVSRLLSAPTVEIVEPVEGTVFAPGEAILAKSRIRSADGVHRVEAVWSGVASHRETIVLPEAPQDTTLIHAFVVPETAPDGKLILEITASNADGYTAGWAQTTFEIETPPVVVDSDPPKLEFAQAIPQHVGDGQQITIRARDASGIKKIGILVLAYNTPSVLYEDSVTFASSDTVMTHPFVFVIGQDFPFGLGRLTAWAEDEVGNRGWFNFAGDPAKDLTDASFLTLTIVAGHLYEHADAGDFNGIVHHAGRGEIYVANGRRNRIEIFDLASKSFVGGIPVGSNPSSLAILPDPMGLPTDRMVVANSGGTSFSVVDVVSRTEAARIPIPGLVLRVVMKDDPTGTVTEYRISDRPAAIHAACIDFGCLAHVVYITTLATPQSDGSVARQLVLASNNQVLNPTIVAPAANPGVIVNDDTLDVAEIRVYELDRVTGQEVQLFTMFDRLLSATIYSSPPLLAMSRTGVGELTGGSVTSVLYVAEPQGSSLNAASRLFVLDASNNWEGKSSAAKDYTRSVGEYARAIEANDDGSMLAVITESGPVAIVDRWLNLEGLLDESGTAPYGPVAVSFLEGHSASLSADAGGLIAVARNAPEVDVYETRSFRLLKTFPIPETVQGGLRFIRTSPNGDVAIVARLNSGLLVIETTIDQIIRGDT